ncbi:zinc finger CCCH domain-containing protein 19, partial [Tanacetum coccineum]
MVHLNQWRSACSGAATKGTGEVTLGGGLKNGYLRKGRKMKPKRQNQTRNGKACLNLSLTVLKSKFKILKGCLEVNIPEVANDSSIVSPSTPPGNDLNIAKESCSTWLDYVGPLITDELDSEKRWSYRDPKGNIQGSFSLAQL